MAVPGTLTGNGVGHFRVCVTGKGGAEERELKDELRKLRGRGQCEQDTKENIGIDDENLELTMQYTIGRGRLHAR